MTRPDVTAVVPYRADASGHRRPVAQAILRWLVAADVHVVLSEHSEVPDPHIEVESRVTRVFTPAHGQFSKAVACNAGAMVADPGVLALVDADTLVSTGALLACARRSASDGVVIRPFGRLRELSREETAAYLAYGTLPALAEGEPSDERGGEHIPPCGGIVIAPLERFWAAGGMDERFEGWGGEDDALSHALARTGADLRVLQHETAFHLWHERSIASRYSHPNYVRNAELARWWATASEKDVAAHIMSGRATRDSGRQDRSPNSR